MSRLRLQSNRGPAVLPGSSRAWRSWLTRRAQASASCANSTTCLPAGGVLLIIVSDYGTELTSRASLAWRQQRDVEWHFIAPRKPLQKALFESLNRRFRNECLNEHSFRGLHMAQRIIEAWWCTKNILRPRTSLRGLAIPFSPDHNENTSCYERRQSGDKVAGCPKFGKGGCGPRNHVLRTSNRTS